MFRLAYILFVCAIFNKLVISASTESNKTVNKTTSNENCSVNTKLGSILGFQSNTIFDEKPFCSYLGIRYALAPTGDRRFKVNDSKIFTLMHLFDRHF